MRITQKLISISLLAVFSMSLLACSIQKGFTRFRATPLTNASFTLAPSDGVYISMPTDYSRNGSAEEKSGEETQAALREALSTLSGAKVFASTPRELAETLTDAQEAGLPYALSVTLTLWQDPPASFQLSADKGEAVLNLYDVESGALLRSDSVECSGAATTINHIGAYSPKDCLIPAFQEWAGIVFGVAK